MSPIPVITLSLSLLLSIAGLGGTCVNVGCIPKKLMHHAALLGKACLVCLVISCACPISLAMTTPLRHRTPDPRCQGLWMGGEDRRDSSLVEHATYQRPGSHWISELGLSRTAAREQYQVPQCLRSVHWPKHSQGGSFRPSVSRPIPVSLSPYPCQSLTPSLSVSHPVPVCLSPHPCQSLAPSLSVSCPIPVSLSPRPCLSLTSSLSVSHLVAALTGCQSKRQRGGDHISEVHHSHWTPTQIPGHTRRRVCYFQVSPAPHPSPWQRLPHIHTMDFPPPQR